jgi:hypothetical protein
MQPASRMRLCAIIHCIRAFLSRGTGLDIVATKHIRIAAGELNRTAKYKSSGSHFTDTYLYVRHFSLFTLIIHNYLLIYIFTLHKFVSVPETNSQQKDRPSIAFWRPRWRRRCSDLLRTGRSVFRSQRGEVFSSSPYPSKPGLDPTQPTSVDTGPLARG